MATQAEKFKEIGNAIRSKTNRTSNIIANNFSKEINCIPTNYNSLSLPFPFGKDHSNFDNAWEALKIAIEYWNAKSSGTVTWAYSDGNGCLKGDTSAKLHDSNGKAIIDCSSFIGLVLRGIGYLDSPYHLSSSQTYNPRNIICKSYSWVETYFDMQIKRYVTPSTFPTYTHKTNDEKYRVLSASDIAQYYDKMGLLWFSDSSEARSGDLCFFYKENNDGTLTYPERFSGISHVGIMTDKNYYLNATDYESSGNLIRTSVTTRPPFMYARPLYGAIKDGATSTITPNKVDLIPNIWSGIKQGTTSGNNGCTLSLTGKKLLISGKGTGIAHDLISSGCPLTLPAGTYKLSGVVNNTGGNTTTNHSYFGVRVYNSDGSGITGQTTTSNGQTVNTRTPVWDIGGGATFTLNSDTSIIMDCYLSANKTYNGLTIEPKLYKIS